MNYSGNRSHSVRTCRFHYVWLRASVFVRATVTGSSHQNATQLLHINAFFLSTSSIKYSTSFNLPNKPGDKPPETKCQFIRHKWNWSHTDTHTQSHMSERRRFRVRSPSSRLDRVASRRAEVRRYSLQRHRKTQREWKWKRPLEHSRPSVKMLLKMKLKKKKKVFL